MTLPIEDITLLEQQEKFYLDLIKDLKTNKTTLNSIDINLHKPTLTLEEIIENLEHMNDKVSEYLLTPKIPVVQHLEYFLEKSKSHEDKKYERIFIQNPNSDTKEPKIGSKLLDYSVKDKLVGFYAKNGYPQWDDEKIKDFIQSIKQSN